MSLPKERYLSVVNRFVHMKDGALTLVYTSELPNLDENFGSNPRRASKPEKAKHPNSALRESIIRPVCGSLNGEKRRMFLLPLEFRGQYLVVNYWIRGDLAKAPRNLK